MYNVVHNFVTKIETILSMSKCSVHKFVLVVRHKICSNVWTLANVDNSGDENNVHSFWTNVLLSNGLPSMDAILITSL